jgi:glycosyltransferase involved in cell wall biosynthesis
MKVSVIIPTYNRRKLVQRAIESVLDQSVVPYEIIVVDDGSTDNTKKEIIKYGSKIKYLYQKNSGKPGAARNLGLKHVQGNWIAFLDSDDVWLPDKLKMQLKLIKRVKENLGIVFSGYEIVRKDKKLRRSEIIDLSELERLIDFYTDEGIILKGEFLYYYLIFKNIIHTSTVLFNKELLKSVSGFDPTITIAEDLDLWLRCVKHMPVGYVPEVTCRYEHRKDNITNDKIFYVNSVLNIKQKYFDKIEHEIPLWLNDKIKTSFREQYRARAFINAKLRKRRDALNDIIKSMKYPGKLKCRYLCQITTAIITPSIYAHIKKRTKKKTK